MCFSRVEFVRFEKYADFSLPYIKKCGFSPLDSYKLKNVFEIANIFYEKFAFFFLRDEMLRFFHAVPQNIPSFYLLVFYLK